MVNNTTTQNDGRIAGYIKSVRSDPIHQVPVLRLLLSRGTIGNTTIKLLPQPTIA